MSSSNWSSVSGSAVASLEEAAVEVAHFFAEHGGEAAGLHAAPQFLDHRDELIGVAVAGS